MGKVPHGATRPPYLRRERPPSEYANEPGRVRRGRSGDKLRRKAFERKL